jgi:hypothetical protein
MYHAFPEDVSFMVDEADSMMWDLFRKKPSDVSISGHSKQIAGIVCCKVLGLLVLADFMCLNVFWWDGWQWLMHVCYIC